MALFYKPQVEGPGIKKNEEKTFSNCLQTFFTHISVLIKTNLVFCLFLIPLVLLSVIICMIVLPDVNILKTGFEFKFVFQIMLIPLPFAFCGPIVSGITKITRDIGRELHVDIFSDFVSTLKRCFFKSFINSVLEYLFYVAAFFAFMVYWGSWVFFSVTMIATLYFTLMQKYIYIMIVSLDLSIRKMYKNAFILILADFKNSIKAFAFLVLEITLAAFYVATSLISPFLFSVSVLLIVLIQFSFPALFRNFYLFKSIIKNVVDPYYKDRLNKEEKTHLSKDSKYDNKASVTEKSEFVYKDGKLVRREVAEKESVFKDNQ